MNIDSCIILDIIYPIFFQPPLVLLSVVEVNLSTQHKLKANLLIKLIIVALMFG